MSPEKGIDGEAQKRLRALKAQLRTKLPDNVYDYTTTWTGAGSTTAHLGKLCEDVYERLSQTILREIDNRMTLDSIDQERNDHQMFGEERAAFFTGRADALREAQLEIKRERPHPYYLGAFICQGDPSPLNLTLHDK